MKIKEMIIFLWGFLVAFLMPITLAHKGDFWVVFPAIFIACSYIFIFLSIADYIVKHWKD